MDQPINALGGLSPRQALTDPVQQAELDALLHDMAWKQRQGGRTDVMDTARVRRLLGLPPVR